MGRIIAVLLAIGSAASGAEVKVLMIGAINPGFANIAAQYKLDGGNNVTAQVDTAPGLTRRIAAGETADILIAPDNVIDDAVKQGKAVASTRTPVAKVGIGVAVRAGTTAPHVATVDALKQALLGAESIVYNQGSSGLYIDKLFEQMGIADQLKARTVRFANAGQVVRHVMEGKGNEIAFAPLPEILSSDPKQLQSAGPLPAAVQNYTSYSGVVMTGGNADVAREFIRYLTAPAAKRTFSAAGVEQ
jgi:molybdate transport system substrate-binding protein